MQMAISSVQAEEVCSSLTFGTPLTLFYSPAESETFEAIEQQEAAFAALCQVTNFPQANNISRQGLIINCCQLAYPEPSFGCEQKWKVLPLVDITIHCGAAMITIVVILVVGPVESQGGIGCQQHCTGLTEWQSHRVAIVLRLAALPRLQFTAGQEVSCDFNIISCYSCLAKGLHFDSELL